MRELIIREFNEVMPIASQYYLTYGENDIRPGFLDGHLVLLRAYYCAYFHVDSDDIILRYHELYRRNNFTRAEIPVQLQTNRNALNSFFIVQSWANFELLITLMSEQVFDEDRKLELFSKEYDRVLSVLKENAPTDEEKHQLKFLIKSHMAHVPMSVKCGALLKHISNYPTGRSKPADLEFLNFYGRVRNCVHSNYIYFGNGESEFDFQGDLFRFVPNHPISQQRADSFLKMSIELRHLAQALIESIPFANEIYDPSIEQMN